MLSVVLDNGRAFKPIPQNIRERRFYVRQEPAWAYRATATLDGPVSGTYRGSPQQVLARLLDGYNYVVKKEAGPLEVLVLGRRGDRAIAAPRPQAPPAANAAGATSLARQWRTPLDAK